MTAPFDPRALLAGSRLGVLATIKSDGRPQLSPVLPHYDESADVIRVSTYAGAAKVANLRRDPRATLEVTGSDGMSWATAEGVATLTGPGTDPDGPEVDALVHYYRAAAGEHPDWDEYRAVMVAERRVLITMTVDHSFVDWSVRTSRARDRAARSMRSRVRTASPYWSRSRASSRRSRRRAVAVRPESRAHSASATAVRTSCRRRLVDCFAAVPRNDARAWYGSRYVSPRCRMQADHFLTAALNASSAVTCRCRSAGSAPVITSARNQADRSP
uniref:Pyridoxamine 5'-phosphate oxidase N-terminal domain-containing protein n=1 Tax=Streptomyces olivaceoviridis TaxID=1921 RepID=Q8GBT5_STROI|nr:hypothetical protein [Streptomyces olivaceoviridis]